jgi:hypothetical protein
MTQRPMTRRPVPPRGAAVGGTSRAGGPTRASGVRRTRPVRRASAGLSPVRAAALLVMLVAAAAVFGVANSSAFTYRRLVVEGAAVTSTEDVADAIAVSHGRNLFGLVTAPLEMSVADLRTVADAAVSVSLPDTLVVHVREREPVLVWRVGARRYLVDADGALFGLLGDHPPATAAALPVVEDRRAASAGLSIGRSLDPVDLDAATRLASLVPGDVGSLGKGLAVLVTDETGFVVVGQPSGWRAMFGFYTASLRTTELIPGQVRLLRSLLIGREPLVDRVVLASETDGTYTTRPSQSPAPSRAAPAASPSVTPTP